MKIWSKKPISRMTHGSNISNFSRTYLHKEYLESLEKEITRAFVYS